MPIGLLSIRFARGLCCLVGAYALTAGISGLNAHAADTIDITLDQAKVLQLPPNTTTVIVGNPVIADVTMLRRTNQMVLTGKGYGETNMIALDSEGNAIGESVVKVSGINHGIIVQRGMARETYSCNPRCQPTVNLGDDEKFMNGTAGQIKARATASGGR
jgi:hypothetical protein